MFRLEIKADYNDADYIYTIKDVEPKILDQLLPLLQKFKTNPIWYIWEDNDLFEPNEIDFLTDYIPVEMNSDEVRIESIRYYKVNNEVKVL